MGTVGTGGSEEVEVWIIIGGVVGYGYSGCGDGEGGEAEGQDE